MSEVTNHEPQNMMRGLIGYTVDGIPYILDPREDYHVSLLPDVDANGERHIKRFYQEDLEEFKKIIKAYNQQAGDRQHQQRLERWNLDEPTNGGDDTDAPLPPGKSARIARK